jgi:ribosomal protein L10
MEYRTMSKKELAAKLKISKNTLTRRMEKHLKSEFVEYVKGKSILFGNEVKYIHEGIGATKEW